MKDGLFAPEDPQTEYFSRSDATHVLGSFSAHGFRLDGQQWPSVEHYYQAMKFTDASYQEKIRLATSPAMARKLGRTRFKRIRRDWPEVKTAYMTRAVYTRCRSHPTLAKALLNNPAKLVENSQYDYYWGCGRDRRGKNNYGLVLMNVRDKLRQEAQAQPG